MFDINVRRLLHAHGTTKGVNHRKKVSRVALMTWETDQVSGKVYRKWLRRRLVDKREVPLRVCEFKMPSKELIDAYERKKKLHLDALNVRLKAKIDAEDEKAYGKLERKPLVLTKRQTEFLEVIQNNNFEQASAIMGVSSARLSHIKLALEERGYGFRAKRLGLNQTLGYEVIPPPTKRVV